jgi:hypothetical protein
MVTWRRRNIAQHATEETGAMGREIESLQGLGWYFLDREVYHGICTYVFLTRLKF